MLTVRVPSIIQPTKLYITGHCLSNSILFIHFNNPKYDEHYDFQNRPINYYKNVTSIGWMKVSERIQNARLTSANLRRL